MAMCESCESTNYGLVVSECWGFKTDPNRIDTITSMCDHSCILVYVPSASTTRDDSHSFIYLTKERGASSEAMTSRITSGELDSRLNGRTLHNKSMFLLRM